eukprot:5475211-Pyramimonas_sp.AAC.1
MVTLCAAHSCTGVGPFARLIWPSLGAPPVAFAAPLQAMTAVPAATSIREECNSMPPLRGRGRLPPSPPPFFPL